MKLLLILLFLKNAITFAQTDNLANLIEERRSLYNSYKIALDQKSGLFGNQTKADISEINKLLKGIITKDNEILAELEQSQKQNYEKLLLKYNALAEENDKLLAKNKGLQNKIEEEKNYQKSNHKTIQRTEGDRILLGFLIIALSIIVIWLLLKNKKIRKKLKSFESQF